MIGANAALASIEDILAALRQSLVETSSFHQPQGGIDLDAPLQKGGLGLDSVAVVEFIAGIETRLGFEFVDSDLVAPSFASLRTLAQVVRNRLENPGAES